MAKTDGDAGDFEFDPNQLGDLSKLAEAFIHEEVDADFFDELDRNYLEQLVDSAESEPPADIDTQEYEAAIEVAELIVDRMDEADY
jgi:HEPN domain-containing protein